MLTYASFAVSSVTSFCFQLCFQLFKEWALFIFISGSSSFQDKEIPPVRLHTCLTSAILSLRGEVSNRENIFLFVSRFKFIKGDQLNSWRLLIAC
jgi:hypothetical protein